MKVRFHKGGLAESMATVFEPLSYEDLVEHIKSNYDGFVAETMVCKLYSDTPDTRIGWDKTFIITVKFKSVSGDVYSIPIAFSDHDIEELKSPSEKLHDLMKARWSLYRSYDSVCEELHQIKCRGSVAASLYHKRMIELEKEMMHPRMQREPTSILKLAKELVECKSSALCHEKTIKELREKRNKLKKNIKGLDAKLSEMELE
mgnify:CR=1 FL=1